MHADIIITGSRCGILTLQLCTLVAPIISTHAFYSCIFLLLCTMYCTVQANELTMRAPPDSLCAIYHLILCLVKERWIQLPSHFHWRVEVKRGGMESWEMEGKGGWGQSVVSIRCTGSPLTSCNASVTVILHVCHLTCPHVAIAWRLG